MKKILVPCDFSDPAVEAFRFATDIAAVSRGEVFVLKAIDVPIMYETTFGVQPYAFNPEWIKELEEDAQSKYEKMRRLFPGHDVKVKFQTISGPVSPVIKRFIAHHAIDLVVMGTHGASGFHEFFIGSNTEKIVRHSPVPVMSVRKAPAIGAVRNIVFPGIPDGNQQGFMNEVKRLQEFFRATLHILWVNTPFYFRRDHEVKASLDVFSRQYDLHNYTLHIRSDTSEQEGILHFADELKADLIAMATHARKGLAHLLYGSIAEDVLNHAAYPIWTCAVR